MGVTRRFVLFLFLLAAGAARADEPATPAPPPTLEQASDAVLAAVKAKDDATLSTLAAKDDPDPWLVADELIRRGELDAADAFARAAPRKDVEQLPPYVASRRGKPDDPARRKRLADLNAALAANQAVVALEVASVSVSAEDVTGIRIAGGRAIALRELERWKESAAAFLAAAGAAETAGWLSRASWSLRRACVTARTGGDVAGFIAAAERICDVDAVRGRRADVAAMLVDTGVFLSDTVHDHPKALSYFERGLKEARAVGHRKWAANALANMAVAHDMLGDRRKALERFEESLVLREELGDPQGVAHTLGEIGNTHEKLGDIARALEFYDRVITRLEDLHDRPWGARILAHAGKLHFDRGNFPRAMEYYERGLREMEELGNRKGVAEMLGSIGISHSVLGDCPKALEHLERSLKIYEDLGDRLMVAWVLSNTGGVMVTIGNFPRALEHQERALSMYEELGDRAGQAQTLYVVGAVHGDLGSYPKALDHLERALALWEELKDRDGVAKTLRKLGEVHRILGSHARALEYLDRALRLSEDVGNRLSVALALGAIGNARYELGEHATALEYAERSRAMLDTIGDRRALATADALLGNILDTLGDRQKAIEHYERALKTSEELKDRQTVGWTLANLGTLWGAAGEVRKAIQLLERAVRDAERIRADNLLAFALQELARAHLLAGDPVRAQSVAKRSIPLLERMLGGLAEEQGVTTRQKHASVFDFGAIAAALNDDAPEVAFFLESGRAGSLMESLGGRQALRWQSLPEELRQADARARAAESVALAVYTRTLDGGSRAEIQASLVQLDAAREEVNEVVDRMQRAAKKDAKLDLFYPRAAPLEEIEGWIAKGEALVLYGLCGRDAIAMVITKYDARVVSIGRTADVTAACEALDLTNPAVDPTAALAALSKLVVAPLGLKDDVTRVLVSPEGPLSYAPMALLLPGRQVAYEPSGTTYGHLLEEEASRKGSDVLALGDPDYGAKFDPHALEAYARVEGAVRGGRLVPLPGTRAEAKAIGTVTLLGKAATEAGLRAEIARKDARWHAIHFACHGLVDPENPTRSSLALTPDAENDGFLTSLEVLRANIPSDLIVLSACETGTGTIFKGEGIVGLTRAFMFAGSPRVICSLWKVDDEATKALMVRFYELWNPQDGTPGLPTAEALRKAQEFVRSQEKWKHPYFWAAWVLWGLPT